MSARGDQPRVSADESPFHGRSWSLEMTLPPLAAVFLKHETTV